MIKKVISGGQTGVDQAALDVAIKLGIPHGGWVPKGRKTEDGVLPDKYQLKEMPDSSYARRTERNVVDADGTLIVSHGRLVGGSEYTRKMALKHGRPYLHVDLTRVSAFDASQKISAWIADNAIDTLNVAGPRASHDPRIYQATRDILEAVYFLNLMDADLSSPVNRRVTQPFDPHTHPPQTVDEALAVLEKRLLLKDKVIIANMQRDELASLNFSLGDYIRTHFKGEQDPWPLLNACRGLSGHISLNEEDVPAVVIEALWKKLRRTHKLRVIK